MRFRTVIDISCAPERVFAVLCDVEGWPSWTPTMTRVTRADPGTLGVGSRATVLQPKLRRADWSVTELTPARRFTWVSRAPGLTMTAAHGVEPIRAGSRVTLSFEVAGWLKVLVLTCYGGRIESYLATEAASLKAHCEASAADL